MGLFDRKRLEVATEGAWVTGKEVEAFGDGAILVRGLASDGARDAFSYKARREPPYSTAKGTVNTRAPDGHLLHGTLARHTREVLAEYAILDAKDIVDHKSGTEYTAELIREMVLDPGYEAMIFAVLSACQHVDKVSHEIEEQTSKNLSPSSSGKPNTGQQQKRTARR